MNDEIKCLLWFIAGCLMILTILLSLRLETINDALDKQNENLVKIIELQTNNTEKD